MLKVYIALRMIFVDDASSKHFSGGELLGLFLLESGIGSAVHEGLDLHSVGWVSNEEWELLSHLEFGEAILTVEVAPELGLEGLSGELGQCDGVHADSGQNLIGGQELFCFCEVVSETGLSHDEWSNVEGSLSAQEFDGGV